jgi:perosamine synthetase
MVLCRDKALADNVRLHVNQGFQQPRFVHQVMGFNYRLTNLQAAIGVAQTEKVEEKVEQKRWIGRTYNELLAGKPDLTLPCEMPWARNVYWMYGILIGDGFGVGRDDLMKLLKDKGVDTRAFFCSMHLQPLFRGSDPRYPDIAGSYPVSADLWKRGLYLPTGLGLTRQQLETVAERLMECHM